MKYVIVKAMSVEIAIMFPDVLTHDAFAQFSLVSAGKFDLTWNNDTSEFSVKAYGKSISLNLASRPEDASLIKAALSFKGF